MTTYLPYEILIRAEGGVLRGAAAYDQPGALARPITADELALFGPAINVASLARIAELESGPAVLPSPDATMLATLDEAFESRVPAAVLPMFEPAWVIVRNLLQAGKRERAIGFVSGLAVPPDLIPVRDEIVALLIGDPS